MKQEGRTIKLSSGFRGKGFKFDEMEAQLADDRKKLQKAALGLHDSDDEDAGMDVSGYCVGMRRRVGLGMFGCEFSIYLQKLVMGFCLFDNVDILFVSVLTEELGIFCAYPIQSVMKMLIKQILMNISVKLSVSIFE